MKTAPPDSAPPPNAPEAAPADADAAFQWLGTFAEPTRVRLGVLLEQAELAVGELRAILRMPQSSVSRHLKSLLEQGWVVARRAGTANRYRLVADELSEAQRALWGWVRSESASWATLEQDDARLRQVLAERTDPDADAFFASMAVADRWGQARNEVYGAGIDVSLLAAAVGPADRVVDFGCGTAELARRLTPWAAEVTGLDSSPEMLAAARRTPLPPGLTLRETDLADSGLAGASADLAICSLVLTYVRDPAAVIAEAARVLACGGRLVVLDVLAHDRDEFRRAMSHARNGFAADDLRALLDAAGFDVPAPRILPPPAAATGPALLLARGIRRG